MDAEQKSCLQEGVGVPLTDEMKAKLMMEYGIIPPEAPMEHDPAETPKKPDATDSGVSTSRKTTGGASSSASTSMVKKSIVKGRELQRRGRGASDSHKRDLNDDFDKELMTDEEVHAGRQEIAAPPEQQADSFWDKV